MPTKPYRRLIEDPSAKPGTRPSIQGYRFLLLMFLLGLAAVNTGNNLIYLILCMISAMLMISMLLVREGVRGLSIGTRAPHPVFAGTDTAIALSVARPGRTRPAFDLRLRLEIPGASGRAVTRIARLDQGGEAGSQLHVCPTRRGRFSMDHLLVSTGFPFGLVMKTVRVPIDESFLVYPAFVETERLALLISGISAGLSTLHKGHGEEYLFDRRYREGDSIRHIHWKATARTGRLMVKEYAMEEPVRISLILETGLPVSPDDFEKAVSVTASLCNHFGQEGLPVRLLAGLSDTGFGSGPRHVDRMLDVLALVRPDEETADRPLEPDAYRLRVTAGASGQGGPDRPADRVIDASVIL